MDIHYNAFISYRHHPDDIRVASQIHRLLEHYRVPRAIRRQSKGITRLFRDKEELPITSNLTEDITRALVNSDYLIVICSTHTRESTWVRREIETFLQTHDRSRILTVLADGEPYDTIPEILLREEKVDPVTGETETVDIEPLSCDWRMPMRQARREELPRLAAALLGCGYDELRRRERQYRTRRMMAVLSAALAAALCFSAYVMHNSMRIQEANDRLEIANGQLENANTQLADANTSLENANAEIQANLNEALINQSQYLASSAEALLEEGDRMTAMLLALEALPGYGGERPYVADAEEALSRAIGAYEVEASLVAAGSFTCDSLVSDFLVTPDGATLYILDSRDVITVWDTNTFGKLATISLSHAADRIRVTAGGNLLVMETGSILACYDRTGSLLWSYTGYTMDIAFLDDRSTVLVGEKIRAGDTACYGLHILDAETGAEVQETLQVQTENTLYFLEEEYSASAPLLVQSYDALTSNLQVLDLETGELKMLGGGYDYIYASCVANDGSLLALIRKEESTGLRGSYMGFLVTAPENLTLQCFSPATGKLLWERDMTTYVFSNCNTLQIIPERDDILCQTGNLFLVVDSATGEIKASSESPSYPIWTRVGSSYTRALLEDGSLGSFQYEDSFCGFIPCAQDDLVSADLWDNDYYVADQLSGRVVAYRYISDTNLTPMGNGEYLYSYEQHTFGDYVALEDYSKLLLLDASAGEFLWKIDTSGAEIIGFSADGSRLLAAGDYSRVLLEIDVKTGTAVTTELPGEAEGISPYTGEKGVLYTGIISREVLASDGFVYYLTEYYSTSQTFLFRFDPAAGTYDYWELYQWDESASYNKYGRLVAVVGDYVLVWNQTDSTLLEFHTGTGQSRVIAREIICLPAFLAMEDGKYLLGTTDTIQLRAWGGEAEMESPLPECRAVSFCRYNDQILALCDDGYLYRFDSTGNVLGRTSLTRYNTFASNITGTNFDDSCINWDFTADGDLILGLCGAGNLVDCESWKARAFLPYYYAYMEDRNMVILKDTSESGSLAAFPLYSTEDIMAMAAEALNGSELTDEQRAAYGLD